MKEKKSPPKLHNFLLNTKLSRWKGKMFKGSSGLYQISDVDKMVYECGKCNSAVEYPSAVDVRSINRQLALRFTCI